MEAASLVGTSPATGVQSFYVIPMANDTRRTPEPIEQPRTGRERSLDTVELAELLISHDTTTPVTDPDIFDDIKRVLVDEGISADIHVNGDVYSLTATVGDGGTRICLNGHVDVVPPGNGWTVTDPFEPEVQDGKLYGRGAADMKGGLAAQIAAFIDLHHDSSFQGEVTLMIVGDEEIGGFDGTEELVPEFPQFDYTIVGEPTDMDIQVGVRGIYWVNVFVNGESAHASRPHIADNAVTDLPEVLDALNDMELTYEEDDILPDPTAPVTVVETEGPQNSLPDRVRIGLDVRYVPGQTEDDIRQDISRALEGIDVEYEISVSDMGTAFSMDDERFKQIATDAVAEVTGRTPKHITNGGSSDGRFFAADGTPFIELGPNQKPGHQTDEWCRVEHLKQLRESYYKIVKRLPEQG